MIHRDKLLHIGLGVLWLAILASNLLVFLLLGFGPALAYGTTAYSALYELNQKVRGEGQPELWDFVATAAPGFVAWGLLEVFA